MQQFFTFGRGRAWGVLLFLLVSQWEGLASGLAASATITINPSQKFQQAGYWEAQRYASHNHPDYDTFKQELFDRAVNEIGINRVRLEVRAGAENSVDNYKLFQTGKIDNATWRCMRYSTVNDNGDSGHLDMKGFNFTELDESIEASILPLRQALTAKGETLYVLMDYVAFIGQMKPAHCPAGLSYHHNDPKEYAEFVLAVFTHVQQKYGFTPDGFEIILEPDNKNDVWRDNGQLIGEAMIETNKLLRANGFSKPDFIAPSTLSMGKAPKYLNDINAVPGAMDLLDEISYHRYSGYPYGSKLEALKAIVAIANQHGKRTYMSEYWNPSNTYKVLHEDLKIGNNSVWQQGYIAQRQLKNAPFLWVDDTDPAGTKLVTPQLTKYLTQYYRYIRPEAVRIGATSNAGVLDPLAFINKNGTYVLVIKADAAKDFTVSGLPSGTYAVTYTTNKAYQKSLGLKTVAAGGTLTANMPGKGVISVVQQLGPGGAVPGPALAAEPLAKLTRQVAHHNAGLLVTLTSDYASIVEKMHRWQPQQNRKPSLFTVQKRNTQQGIALDMRASQAAVIAKLQALLPVGVKIKR